MDKRYQVFVSSTFADLREERRRVIQVLMEMDGIPAGMELFPAADEEQWQFIKKVIDDCDYYILIIGGRYGSTTAEGVSYTEKEYDYAQERGLKVLAFVHDKPKEIPVGKSDTDPNLAERLQAFRDKVKQGRLVKMWNKAEELPGLVALSLNKTIKTYPAVGWVRADKVASTELLTEVNALRKRNVELEATVARLGESKRAPVIEGLASLQESFEVSGTHSWRDQRYAWKCTQSWGQLFAVIAPYLLTHPNDNYVSTIFKTNLHKLSGGSGSSVTMDDQAYQTVKLQLKALGLIDVKYAQATNGTMALFWSLTPQGEALMMQLRTVKTTPPEQHMANQATMNALLAGNT
jgi:hypothetical protein